MKLTAGRESVEGGVSLPQSWLKMDSGFWALIDAESSLSFGEIMSPF